MIMEMCVVKCCCECGGAMVISQETVRTKTVCVVLVCKRCGQIEKKCYIKAYKRG